MRRTLIRYRLKAEKGFILAEVSLAILIISLTLLAISALFTQAIQNDGMANHYTAASNLAQKQLELLKTYPPEYWSGLTLPCTIPWSDNTQLPLSMYKLTTNAVLWNADDHLVEVTVTASWQERGIDCNLQFITLYPKL